MKKDSEVNQQVVNAVVTSNVQNVAVAPATAMGMLYTSISNSVSMAAMNAVYAQQQTNILHQSVTARSVALLLGDDD